MKKAMSEPGVAEVMEVMKVAEKYQKINAVLAPYLAAQRTSIVATSSTP